MISSHAHATTSTGQNRLGGPVLRPAKQDQISVISRIQQKYRGVIYRRERDRSDASGEAENGNSGSFFKRSENGQDMSKGKKALAVELLAVRTVTGRRFMPSHLAPDRSVSVSGFLRHRRHVARSTFNFRVRAVRRHSRDYRLQPCRA